MIYNLYRLNYVKNPYIFIINSLELCIISLFLFHDATCHKLYTYIYNHVVISNYISGDHDQKNSTQP